MPEMKLPELGENVAEGDVLRVLISPGQTVQKDQPVLELETDKATIEVPSSVAGVVQEVRVKVGEKVKTGQVIFTVGDTATKGKSPEPAAAPVEPAASTAPGAEPAKADPDKKDAEPVKNTARSEAVASAEVPATSPAAVPDDSPGEGEPDEPGPAPAPKRRGEVVQIARPAAAAARDRDRAPADDAAPSAAAAPSIRRLARELGIDIDDVTGTGPDGRISEDDVKAHVRRLVSHSEKAPQSERVPLPDFSRWGDVERKPMSGIRRKTAQHLSQAWTTIPHVTQHDRADVTQLDIFRKQYEKQVAEAGAALTVTAMLLKVVGAALKTFPQVNASVDVGAEEIIYKKYVHVGVAVDTDRGLLVPVIRDADTKNIVELSSELKQLAERARAHKLTLDEMQGGSFTVTNLGGFGGTYFSPIVNWPEVAILGVSRAATWPVYVDGVLKPRLLLPLSLSYDHRVVDGADAIRFLRWIIEALEQPMMMALQS